MIIQAPAVQSSRACSAGAQSTVFSDDSGRQALLMTPLRLIPFTVRADRIAANGGSQQRKGRQHG